MVAPVPMTSSSGWAWTSSRLRVSVSVTAATLRGVRTPDDRRTRRRSAMLVSVDFPELADRTALFSRGAPHAIRVGGDGARVVFLRSAGPEDDAGALWTLTIATGVERLIADPAGLIEQSPTAEPGGIRA